MDSLLLLSPWVFFSSLPSLLTSTILCSFLPSTVTASLRCMLWLRFDLSGGNRKCVQRGEGALYAFLKALSWCCSFLPPSGANLNCWAVSPASGGSPKAKFQA
uniref:Uncharacterized protein n=1 Tax=Ursus americanus TaxID=9643 RepID=A0A452QIH8_URSAM